MKVDLFGLGLISLLVTQLFHTEFIHFFFSVFDVHLFSQFVEYVLFHKA